MRRPPNILLGPEYTWQLLRAFAKLRDAGQTDSAVVQRNPVYARYRRRQLLGPKPGRPHLTVAYPSFDAVYDQEIGPYYELMLRSRWVGLLV